jgi:hypothetical protein
MRPRLLTRTHYQIDEPAYLRLLILACSSCTQSDYADRVACRLADELQRCGQKLNHGAARYCVDLAHAVGLLTKNNTWTDLGMLLYTVSRALGDPGDLALTIAEQLLFFRLFLEADGAALIFLANFLQHHGQVPARGHTWIEGTNHIANDMFIACFAEYLDLTSDPAERTGLRQILERRKERLFRGNSGRHQMSLHLQTMYRLGLIVRDEQNSSRIYSLPPPRPDMPLGLWAFTESVPDARALEDLLRKRTWPHVAGIMFRNSLPANEPAPEPFLAHDLLDHLRATYDVIRTTGVPLCSLTSVIESLQIGQLSRVGATVTYANALDLLTALQRRHPREVQFHVDRTGRPAFIKLSDGFVP